MLWGGLCGEKRGLLWGRKEARNHMSRFSPYEDNGGTCLAVAGEDFCVVAADTRMSQGYSILTRKSSKIQELSSSCVLATAGMQSDACTLRKVLRMHATTYEHDHHKSINMTAMGQLMCKTLYSRRFFPYYTFNIVAGIDEDGKGGVYSYDAIGNGERTKHACQGSGQALIIPFLDNQVLRGNQDIVENPVLSKEDALALVKDAFASAAERDIYTGDFLEICVITEDGVEHLPLEPLRKD